MPKTYRIGTRGSLLAKTQSTQIKNLLEEKTGNKFEIHIIKTQGDLNTSVPLWQLEGKDFFTKELDEALLKNEIDLVVHSYKDLGSERPEGIGLAAITKRSYAHDILLIRKESLPRLAELTNFVVGTSSPRRIVNIEKSLANYIPVQEGCKVETKMLRGNVNTRIQKLRDGQYDAIVLALAGLERLALSPDSKIELEKLLEGITYMVLPQSVFPSSASQGALGIECRQGNNELEEQIGKLKDQKTIDEVNRERKAFNNYGGGCHLAVGIHVRKTDEGFVHIHKGEQDENKIEELKWESESNKLPQTNSFFLGLPPSKENHYPQAAGAIFDHLIEKKPLILEAKPATAHYYVTSSYCVEAAKKLSNSNSFLWAAGTKTHQLLVKQKLWVHGNADFFGEEELNSFANSQVLKILNSEKLPWKVLTHANANSQLGDIIPCYEHGFHQTPESFHQQVLEQELFYWSSFTQYQKYLEKFPSIANKAHACGLGKTFQLFKKNNISVTPFFNIESFLNTLNKTGE